MVLFQVVTDSEEKQVILHGDTEENLNDGFYPDRVELFGNGSGWLVDANNIKKMGLLAAIEEQRGIKRGGIRFCHEEEDGYGSAEQCLIDLMGQRFGYPFLHLYVDKDVNPFRLPDGFYSI